MGVLLEAFPHPVPPQVRNEHTWQGDKNAQNVFPLRQQGIDHDHVQLFLSCCRIFKSMLPGFYKMHVIPKKGFREIYQRNAGMLVKRSIGFFNARTLEAFS